MFVRAVCAAIAGLFLVSTLKQCKSDYAPAVTLCVCIYIITLCIDGFMTVYGSIAEEIMPIDGELSKALLKIVGISYMRSFVCGICNDYGQKSIAEKADIAARIAAVSVVAPHLIKVYVYIIKLL